jgi:hypothetical protein
MIKATIAATRATRSNMVIQPWLGNINSRKLLTGKTKSNPLKRVLSRTMRDPPCVRYAHKLAGHSAPTDDERVKAIMRGIRRSIGMAPRKKTPANAERIVAMALAPMMTSSADATAPCYRQWSGNHCRCQ